MFVRCKDCFESKHLRAKFLNDEKMTEKRQSHHPKIRRTVVIRDAYIHEWWIYASRITTILSEEIWNVLHFQFECSHRPQATITGDVENRSTLPRVRGTIVLNFFCCIHCLRDLSLSVGSSRQRYLKDCCSWTLVRANTILIQSRYAAGISLSVVSHKPAR